MNAKKLMTLTAAFCVAAALPSMAANWTGNGADTLWSTAGNWDSVPANNSNASLAFRQSNVGNRTATLDGTYTYSGNIHVGAGSSAANPYIFESTDPANVLTIKDDTWLGYHENGWLWIKSGKYVLNDTGGKNFHVGEGYKATRNFWLRVGDGASTVSVKARNGYVRGGSTFIADSATLSFGEGFYLYETATMACTNSTMTTVRDLNIAQGTGNTCKFTGVNTSVKMTNGSYVFNVGNGENSTGVVEKDGGEWDVYYLRVGTGKNSTGTFTMDGGTMRMRTQFGIGVGANSTGTFYLNGGTVKAKRLLVSSTATSTLVIDGGTLQADGTSGAWIDSPINIKIGANGGTIHTDGGNVVISPAVNAVENTAGAFTVTGGGSATFSAGGNVTGAFSLGEDTELHFFDADATVANYTFDSLTVGAGSTLALDVDATGCDTFTATTLNVSATAEKTTTFRLIVRAMPESGRAFPILAMSEADAANFKVTAETPAGAPLVVEKGWANGFLTYAIFARDYVWNDGSNGGGWTAGAKWNVDDSASAWDDNNKAIFASAGDVATLDADVTVVALDFRANATVNVAADSAASISVPEVVVASGVSATVNAPFSSVFTKKGTGTLVLGTNRTEQTVLEEGTLALACANALDWTKFTFGTDPAKPVTLRVGPDATLANRPLAWTVGNLANITSTVVKTGGDWTNSNFYVADAASAVTTVIQEGGTWTLTSTADFGKNSTASHAYFDIAGGTVFHTGYIHNGASSPATITVRAGAKYEMTQTQSYGFIVSGSSTGTLNVLGGEAIVLGPLNFCYRGGNGEVNVTDGGMLTMTKAQLNAGSGSSGTAALTLDGGTLRAIEDNSAFIPNNTRLSFAVGANGGTLDANGKAITIARPISGAGGMAFTGGGRVTFTVDNTYTGATTVEVGTAVYIPSLSSISGGFSLTLPETPLTDGVYTVLALTGTGSGTFAASALTGLEPPTGGRFVLSGDSKAILCIVGDPGFVWIGASSGNLSDASKWANNMVPQSGDSCIIGSASPADLTLGDTFAPSEITFPSESALVTISGERTLSGLTSIVNNSSQHHVLAFPVDARAATPDLSLAFGDANYLVFSGGIALTSMPSVGSMRIAGEWNLDGDWNEPPSGASILSGSTVNVSGTLHNGYNLVINKNATLNVAEVKAAFGATNKNRFLYENDGTFNVTGEMLDTIGSNATTSYSLAGFFAKASANAVTRANGLVHNGSTQKNHQFYLNNVSDSVVNTIVLGSGGLSFRDNLRSNSSCYPYFMINSGKTVVLASSADWSFGTNPTGHDLCLELGGAVTVDTSDYDDRTVAHTIRSLGRIGSGGSMTVKGCGKIVFEYASDFMGELTVQDTATVSVKVGCGFTRSGNATVNSGATLEMAQSGSVTFGKNLTLADGAILGFNFTEKAPPVLNMADKTLTLGGQSNVVVKVTSEEGRRPWTDASVLTAGGKFAGANVSLAEDAPQWVKGVRVENNEIVLDVWPSGTVIFVR